MLTATSTSRTLAFSLSLLAIAGLAAACGPGRQAAWEKESAEKMQEGAEAPAAAEGEATDPAQAADEAWAQRDDRAQLDKAISLWETALEANPDDPALLTKLSRAYYLLADGFLAAEGDDEAMLATYEKGILAGENAMMAASPEFAAKVKAGEKVEQAVSVIPVAGQEAIYWYASNLGKFAVAKGFTTTLFYKDRIYAVMQHVLGLDETFFHGAPHRYFGAFYAKAPAFAGGDMDKAKQHFDKALELDPNYFGTKVLYAQYYAAKADDRDLFVKLLTEVKEGDPASIPELLAEQKIEQDKAARLLAQEAELF